MRDRFSKPDDSVRMVSHEDGDAEAALKGFLAQVMPAVRDPETQKMCLSMWSCKDGAKSAPCALTWYRLEHGGDVVASLLSELRLLSLRTGQSMMTLALHLMEAVRELQ